MSRLCLILASATLLTSSTASPLQSALQSLLDEKVQSYKQINATGFQLSWKSNDEEFTVASGTAGSRKVNTKDTFLFGSGAKPFTAAAIMKRWEQGKLDLNATVAHYVDSIFHAKLGKTFLELFGPNATTMTVWHLVTMQSGIPDFDVPSFDDKVLRTSETKAWTPLDMVVYAASQPWTNMPGAAVFYTSTNFILLGYVLLAVEGKSIDEWASVDQRDIAPISKFPDLNFVNNGSVDKYLTVPGFASGTGQEILNTSANIMGWTCGNLVGTSRGMAAWMWELLVAKSVVGPKALELMSAVQPISFGWGQSWLAYGAGLFVQQMDSKNPLHYGDWVTTLGHGGDTYGFISDQGHIPQLNATYSYIGNSDGGISNFDVTCNLIKTAAKALKVEAPDFKCGDDRERSEIVV